MLHPNSRPLPSRVPPSAETGGFIATCAPEVEPLIPEEKAHLSAPAGMTVVGACNRPAPCEEASDNHM